MEKRVIKNKIETKKYVLDNIETEYNGQDYGAIHIIFTSVDNRIIMYENLAKEEIVICNRVKNNSRYFKKKIYNHLYLDEEDKLVYLLIGFLEDNYKDKYIDKTLSDFITTDLEEYENFKLEEMEF